MKKQILIVDSEDRQLHRIEKVLQDAAEEIGVKIEIHTGRSNICFTVVISDCGSL